MDEVVLLDESGNAVGTAEKHGVHHEHTELHLAFSSYVFDADRRVLLTRRAEHKLTWPGAWTNTCCGHPQPGERIEDSVRRRLSDELGLRQVGELDLVLPRFRYRAVMPDGTVENEMCPVFRALVHAEPSPNADEVAEAAWLPWQEFADTVLSGERTVSPWCVLQVTELVKLGQDPFGWPSAERTLLPSAAR